MAVMTTQQPEGVALEQKAQPVPSSSSDEMALDLEINGTSHRDGPSAEIASNDTAASLPKPVIPSPSNEPSSSGPAAVNGAPNNTAFDSSTPIPTIPPEQSPLQSQLADPSSSAAESSSHLPDTNTTAATATTEEDQLSITQPASLLPDTSADLLSTDAAIEAAVEDTSGTSTVPPIVEAQESDVRDSTPALPTESIIEHSSSPGLPTEAAGQSPALDSSTTEHPLLSEQTADSLGPGPSSSFEDLSAQLPPALNLNLPSQQELDSSAGATITVDQEVDMMDAPQLLPPSKVSREREDDEEAERSAKRTKTEDDFGVEANATNGVGASITHNGEPSGISAEAGPQDERLITQFAVKEVTKHVKNAARTADGKHFKDSVAVLWPSFAEAYAAKIHNAIDLAAIERKLKASAYITLKDVKDDIALLRSNAITFNGEENPIAQSAVRAAKALIDKLEAMPADPVPAPKKEKKSKASTPVGETAPRVSTARRQSRVGANPSVDAAPSQTFALDPQSNTPLIRRDSTKGDGGRPKREIHPPKNKDLPYPVRPKSKKFATELRWCEDVLNEFKKAKYADFTYPFTQPVDPVAQGIPTYFNIIKTPMDISTVTANLMTGQYPTSKEFEKDFNLIASNCFKFNPVGNPIHELGKKFEALWKDLLAKKSRWMADHAPAAASVSPTPDSEPEESEEEEPAVPPSVSNVSTEATKRLVEEQQKLIALMSSPGTNPSLINIQKAVVKVVEEQINQETEAAAAAAALAAKKSKKGKAAKPAPPLRRKSNATKKATAAGNKAGARKQERYMGTLEKEVISAGIATLPENVSAHVLKLIQDGQPGVETEDDGTLELDIDAIPTPTLWKIYDLIKTYTPDIERDLRRQFQERDAPRAAPKPAPKKKNRPMNKYEQDRKIEHLKNQMQTFERGGSGSQEPIPTVEGNNQDDSSGDEEESDSEEE